MNSDATGTFYPVLAVMVAWLVEQQVTHVAMESTGVYRRPVFHALCEATPGVSRSCW